MNAPVVLLGLLLLAVLFVIVPVGLAVYAQYRKPRQLRCPVTEHDAVIRVDAGEAATAEILGRSSVRVRSCSLWPENFPCGEECLTHPEATPPAQSRVG